MTTSQECRICWLNTITLKTKSSIEKLFRVNKKSPYGTEVDIQMHHRSKRGFWDGLEFKLSTPSVDWQKKVGTQALGASFGVMEICYWTQF
jgi:hypothetical protein